MEHMQLPEITDCQPKSIFAITIVEYLSLVLLVGGIDCPTNTVSISIDSISN